MRISVFLMIPPVGIRVGRSIHLAIGLRPVHLSEIRGSFSSPEGERPTRKALAFSFLGAIVAHPSKTHKALSRPAIAATLMLNAIGARTEEHPNEVVLRGCRKTGRSR